MHSGSIEEAVRRTMPQIQGAYSLLVMSPQKLIAARDPNGFRPLCMGRLGKGYVFASETCALDAAARNLSGMWNREKSWWWIPAG